MRDRRLSRRSLLGRAPSAPPRRSRSAPAGRAADQKGASLRLWILKTYVEPTNKAV